MADIMMKQIAMKQIEALVKECGKIILNADRSKAGIDEKAGHGNFVTKYDKMVQDKLEKGLAEIMPEALFVGEESVEQVSAEKGYAFIVDPIDGTMNFIKDYHFSCISVGVTKDAERIAAVVYNPYADEMFTAEKGKGAFLNGQPIHVSNQRLKEGMTIFGTAAYYEELAEITMKKALEYLGKSADLRRSGSAALDLCNVAAGRAELYFEYRICPWDYAAGSLIVEEAGGTVTQVDGSPITVLDKCSMLARGTGVNIEKL